MYRVEAVTGFRRPEALAAIARACGAGWRSLAIRTATAS